LDRTDKPDGLYPTYISPETGKFIGQHVSLGALGDSFFEILLKSWLMSGKKNSQAYRMYKEASRAIRKK
jgi:mannosyl-oligosaccharide alpha-1,2-mannosidase